MVTCQGQGLGPGLDLKGVLRHPITNSGVIGGEVFEWATKEGEYFKNPFKDVRTTFVLDQEKRHQRSKASLV